MENNIKYDELLVRYLFNEETEEENVFVENWINASEENRRYFNQLKKAWQLTDIKQDLAYIMDGANLEEKWDRLEQNINEEDARIIPMKEQEMSEVEYEEEERSVRKPVVYRLLVSVAIAASVLLVVGLGWKLFVGNKVETPVVQNTGEKRDSIVFVFHHEVNTTGKEKRFQLSDGSVITLADKSEITYTEPFTNKREINLTGKAFFKVAKDETRPFTVISGAISTTALGTEFTVTAFEKTNKIVVRLYEGKVVVKAVDKANKGMKNDIYLLPGQEFVYVAQRTAKVRAFTLSKDATPEQIIKEEFSGENPSMPYSTEGSWYMFNNQPLDQVLDQFSQMFNVQIAYDKKDVENIYYTRKFKQSDSLEAILKEIGTIHHLTITKKDNVFIITK